MWSYTIKTFTPLNLYFRKITVSPKASQLVPLPPSILPHQSVPTLCYHSYVSMVNWDGIANSCLTSSKGWYSLLKYLHESQLGFQYIPCFALIIFLLCMTTAFWPVPYIWSKDRTISIVFLVVDSLCLFPPSCSFFYSISTAKTSYIWRRAILKRSHHPWSWWPRWGWSTIQGAGGLDEKPGLICGSLRSSEQWIVLGQTFVLLLLLPLDSSASR